MEYLKRYLVPILGGVALLAAGAAYYFWHQVSVLTQDPRAVSQQEVKKIVATVGQLILLPEGEEPTLATISDPDKLRDQPFFLNAKQGDKVLIYTNAKKAILYDPISNKIIDVAPINIGNSPKPTPSTSPDTTSSTTKKKK